MFHILAVDDDKHTRQLLRAILESAGYTVSTAADGEKALELMDTEHPEHPTAPVGAPGPLRSH